MLMALTLQASPSQDGAGSPPEAEAVEAQAEAVDAVEAEAEGAAPPSRLLRQSRLVMPAQAVVHIHDEVTPDEDFRLVDHGDILSQQKITPAAYVTLTEALRNGRSVGPVGTVLWQAVDAKGEWWCWRDLKGFPVWFFPPSIYCYQDADGDGQFDVLRETLGQFQTYGHSRILIASLGHETRMRGTATYVQGGERDFQEIVALRYEGPAGGIVKDGRIYQTAAVIEVLGGLGAEAMVAEGLTELHKLSDQHGMDVITQIFVLLDEEGRGHYKDDRGLEILVDGINADGSARLKLVSGLSQGRQLLQRPAPDFDYLRAFMRAAMAER